MRKNVIPSLHMHEYLNRSIPKLDETRAQKIGYRSWEIDSDAKENKERLVDVRQYGIKGVNHYHSSQNPPYYKQIPGSTPALLVRETVAQKLAAINRKIERSGIELFVFDAWRPLEIQNYFHDVWFPEKIRQRNPEWEEDKVMEEVEHYWAKGGSVNLDSPPPHLTGGAVDLTLMHTGGQHLWMGTLFDDVTSLAHTDSLEVEEQEFSFTKEEARRNRRLLYWLLKEEGFQNNPTEWWHFSYGDQMWAKLRSAEEVSTKALYSGVLGN